MHEISNFGKWFSDASEQIQTTFMRHLDLRIIQKYSTATYHAKKQKDVRAMHENKSCRNKFKKDCIIIYEMQLRHMT